MSGIARQFRHYFFGQYFPISSIACEQPFAPRNELSVQFRFLLFYFGLGELGATSVPESLLHFVSQERVRFCLE
jgi:hypothetical protein